MNSAALVSVFQPLAALCERRRLHRLIDALDRSSPNSMTTRNCCLVSKSKTPAPGNRSRRVASELSRAQLEPVYVSRMRTFCARDLLHPHNWRSTRSGRFGSGATPDIIARPGCWRRYAGNSPNPAQICGDLSPYRIRRLVLHRRCWKHYSPTWSSCRACWHANSLMQCNFGFGARLFFRCRDIPRTGPLEELGQRFG